MVLQIGFFFDIFQLKYFTIHPLLIFDQNPPIHFLYCVLFCLYNPIIFLKHWMSVDFCLTKVSIFTKYETFLYKRLGEIWAKSWILAIKNVSQMETFYPTLTEKWNRGTHTWGNSTILPNKPILDHRLSQIYQHFLITTSIPYPWKC